MHSKFGGIPRRDAPILAVKCSKNSRGRHGIRFTPAATAILHANETKSEFKTRSGAVCYNAAIRG
jgi:hypothetical protein